MSRAYIGLAVSISLTAVVIAYVHHDQQQQIARMRRGVYSDFVREQTRRQAVEDAAATTSITAKLHTDD